MLTILSADPPVWPNLLNLRTCDHVWTFSEIQYAVGLLTVPFSLVLIVGFGHHGKHSTMVCRQALLLWVNLRRELLREI
jgi:hypothetical protein